MSRKGVVGTVMLCVALAVLLVAGSAQAGLQSVWAVDDGEKIFRDNITSPLKTGQGNSVWNGSSVSLFGARNEIVAFQLILQADGSGATNADVTISDLTNGGYTIKGSHPLPAPNNYIGVGVELFTEHYFNVSVLSGDPSTGYFNWSASAAPSVSGMTTGWMPDAMVPFSAASGKGGAPFNISASQNQGVWVDIYVDKGLPAGTYTGTITVKLNGVTERTIPLSLQALGFTLPDENHYKTMIYYSDYCIDPRFNLSSANQWPMMLNFNKMAHRHRLDLIGGGTWDEINNMGGLLSGAAYTAAQNYEGPGENVGNTLFSICTYGVSWTDTEAAYRTESDAWENWFAANAPGVTRFLYLIDEPGSDQYSWIQTRCDWIHNNPGPGHNLPVFLTKQVTDALIGYVDIWGSPTASYDQTAAAAARARGEDVWPYAAYRPKSAADVIDDWGIAYRIKPWIAKKCDIPRWFTWESTHYIRNPNEINPDQPFDVWTDPLSFHTSDPGSTGNGDGTMMYPGRDYVFTAQDRQFEGPVSSYRMKMYRRGEQDYEYMWMADQAGKGTDVQKLLQDLLPHVMDTALTVPDWSNSDYPYEQARAELADLALGTVRAPSAKFQADKTRGTSPLTVNFTDLSIFAPTSWSWSFGDGGASTSQNPSHVYSGVGSFTVSLTAKNAQGQDTETKANYITLVQEAIVYADAWASQGGKYSTVIVSGGLADLHQDDGVYMVTRPSNAGAKYSSMYTTHSGYTPAQVARITIEHQAKTSDVSQPSSALLFVRRPDTGWNLISDGAWKPGTSDTDYTWDTTSVSTYLGSDGIMGFEMCGCPSSKNKYDISADLLRWRLELAGGQPPVADFSGSPTSGPAPLNVAFTDTSSGSPTSWSWAFGDGGTSAAQNPSHQYTAVNTYTVSLTATNAYGSDTETKTNYITVSAPTAPTFVAAGAAAYGTGAITPALPAGIATNDILLLCLETANQAISITNQNGGTWTEVTNSPQSYGTAGASDATRLTVFWSRYNGTQGAPTASDSGNHQIGRVIAIRGAATSGNPWDVTAGGTESTVDTSGAIPGAATTVANTLVVAAIATSLPDASGTANFSAWANGDLTSVTERTDNTRNAGNGGGLGVATGAKATAGAYGSTAVTCATATTKAMLSIAIKP